MSDKETIKINHPEHGHVVFSQMSSRQMDILENYEELLQMAHIYANDMELGKQVRKLLNK